MLIVVAPAIRVNERTNGTNPAGVLTKRSEYSCLMRLRPLPCVIDIGYETESRSF